MSSVTTPNKALRDALLHPHFIDEETEAQKGSAPGARSHSQGKAELGFEPEVSEAGKNVYMVGEEGVDTYHTCPRPRRGR